jgi:hypothetical protein
MLKEMHIDGICVNNEKKAKQTVEFFFEEKY